MTAATAATAAAAAGPAAARPAPARRGSAGGSARARSSAGGSAAANPAAAGAGAGKVAGLLGKVLPYLTVVIAVFAPLAAAVYLVVSTGWSVAERWVFTRARHREAVAEGAQGGQGRQGGGQISGDPPRADNKVGGRAHRP